MTSAPARPLRVVSVVDAVADALRDGVLDGTLPPGEALPEAEVATRYGVARPTARAAIEKLVAERLLDRGSHKVARVRTLGPGDVRDVYRTREHLESAALRQLAAERRVPPTARDAGAEIRALREGSALAIVRPDMAFHTALVDGLGSERMSRVYRSLASEVTLCMAQVQGRGLLDAELIAAEHDRIVDLVAAGDAEAACAALREHLARACDRLVGALADPG